MKCQILNMVLSTLCAMSLWWLLLHLCLDVILLFQGFMMSSFIFQVHFVDTFKFFLSLYGHKLPVLCMDISSDGDLIVTGSADKNLKIWGLDFGDCHKSIFAHDDRCCIIFRDSYFSFFISFAHREGG